MVFGGVCLVGFSLRPISTCITAMTNGESQELLLLCHRVHASVKLFVVLVSFCLANKKKKKPFPSMTKKC